MKNKEKYDYIFEVPQLILVSSSFLGHVLGLLWMCIKD